MSSVGSGSTRPRVGVALRTEELEFLAPYERLMKHYLEHTEPEILRLIFMRPEAMLPVPRNVRQMFGDTGVFLERRLWRKPPHI